MKLLLLEVCVLGLRLGTLGIATAFSPPLLGKSSTSTLTTSSSSSSSSSSIRIPQRLAASSSSEDELSPENSDNSKNDENDVDEVRKQLESLMGSSSTDDDDSSSSEKATSPSIDLEQLLDQPIKTFEDKLQLESLLPPPPPLTSTERDRRLLEMELIEALATTDDASGQLWELWYSERGQEAKKKLAQADQYLAQGQSVLCEQMLKNMIEEYSFGNVGQCWVEPMNRLATIYFLQNRLEESYKLCLIVLLLKPWHFGALSGIVQVCTRLADRDNARSWATKCLPPLIATSPGPPFDGNADGPPNPQRRNWVDNAKKQAQEALSHLEYQTQRDFMGSPEDYYRENSAPGSDSDDQLDQPGIEDIDDAWQ